MSKAVKNVSRRPLSRDEERRAQALRRKKLRRRRQFIFYSILLIMIIGIGTVLSLTVFFNIEEIVVSGRAKYSATEIVKASGINLKDNMLLCNTKQAQANIEKQLPYVGQAVIKRKLPASIEITVSVATADYAVKQDDGYALLTSEGKVLEKNVGTPSEGLTKITGAEIKSAVIGEKAEFAKKDNISDIQKIVEAAKLYNLKGITEINIADTLNVKLNYKGRISIVIGPLTNLNYKMKFAKKALDSIEKDDPNSHGTLDLTIYKKAYFNDTSSAQNTTQKEQSTKK